jgi:hypothetical protein
MIATPTLSAAEHPRQVKLLGATVTGLGTVVVVSQRLTWGYALVEDQAGKTHHRFLSDLRRDQVTFPAEQQPYRAATERIGIGTWDEVYSLVTTVAVGVAVAA